MLYELINETLPANYKRYSNFESEEMMRLIKTIERSWVQGANTTSIPYWMDQLGHEFVRKAILVLSKSEWIISKVSKKFGSIELNINTLDKHLTQTEQDDLRRNTRLRQYKMRCVEEVQASNLTSTPSGVKETGLDRPGFALAANSKFSLDTAYIAKYYEAIKANAVKSMEKLAKKSDKLAKALARDKANYGVIVEEVLNSYLFNPDAKYNMEANLSDQRGRSIYKGLKRVLNPVASKDARSLLMVDKPVVVCANNTQQMDDIYLFIAELIGSKPTSWEHKKLIGMDCYATRDLHDLDLTDEDDRKELHENIWLERIYSRLDMVLDQGYALWDTPLELDQTMSLAQVEGTLLNDSRLLNATNVINPDDLRDAWDVDGVQRLHTKTVGTPKFYGSSASPQALLKSKGLECTKEELRTLNKEFRSGKFGLLVAFKDFLIDHSNLRTPQVQFTVWDETYTVEVNKHKPTGLPAESCVYTARDSATNRDRVFINHKPSLMPDYKRFKLFYPTGLVHNLDARVMDKCMYAIISKGEWAISIHDAALVLPGTAMREEFVLIMEDLRANRHNILNNYRKSLNAVGPAADKAWDKLQLMVQQLDDSVSFSGSMLK